MKIGRKLENINIKLLGRIYMRCDFELVFLCWFVSSKVF